MFKNVGLESPNKRPMTAPPAPYGKKPALDVTLAIGKGKPGGSPMDPEESAESPTEEAGEDYGAKLLTDMKQPLLDAGMDDATAKSTLAGIFKSMAACLEGGAPDDSGGMPPEMGSMGDDQQ